MILTKSTATEYYAPPQWAWDYLCKLKSIVQFNHVVELYCASSEVFDGQRIGITESPDGYTVLSKEGPAQIVLRSTVADDDKGRNLICHEFVHVLHHEIDRLSLNAMSEDDQKRYVYLVEDFVRPFMILLRLADVLNAEFAPEDSGPE